MKSLTPPIKPVIHGKKVVARSRLFCVEQLELTFSNGAERTYERLVAGGRGAVMIAAINENNEILLIREYGAGVDDYQLALPKGLVDDGESAQQAANRELQEEAGFAARQLCTLKEMTLAPGYLNHRMQLILAQDLFASRLEGDEPEPIEVVPWPMERLSELMQRPDFTEARSIAALFLVKEHLNKAD